MSPDKSRIPSRSVMSSEKPVDQDHLEEARASIRKRVDAFRKQQAELQAEREARWDRIAEATRKTLHSGD